MRCPTLVVGLAAIFTFFTIDAAATSSSLKRVRSHHRPRAITLLDNTPSVQHWSPPDIAKSLNFSQSSIDKVSTVLTQPDKSNPFVYESPATAAAKGKSRIVNGVVNALGPGQDPSPLSRIESDGQRHYYFPTIDYNKGVYMQTSTDLNTVLSVASNEHLVYTYSTQIGTEAPGIFQWDANNYLMYISSVGSDGGGYIYVLHNDGHDLLSGWTDLGRVTYADGAPMANYDAQPFVHPNGKRYLLYATLHSVRLSRLYSYTAIGRRDSETIVADDGGKDQVVEAPGVVIKGSTINIFWSEGNYFLPNYNTRVAAISTSKNPAKTSYWSAARHTTILESNSQVGVYAPGSSAVFTGPDGSPWIAYTCFYNPNGYDPSKENPRRIQAQPLAFSGNRMAPMTPDMPQRYT